MEALPKIKGCGQCALSPCAFPSQWERRYQAGSRQLGRGGFEERGCPIRLPRPRGSMVETAGSKEWNWRTADGSRVRRDHRSRPARVRVAEEEAGRIGLAKSSNPVDIGVRVEVPAGCDEGTSRTSLTKRSPLHVRLFPTIRSGLFCMNPYGEVVMENLRARSHRERAQFPGTAGPRSPTSHFGIEPTSPSRSNDPNRLRHEPSRAWPTCFPGACWCSAWADLRAGRRSTRDRIAKSVVKPTLTTRFPGT